MEIVLTNGDDDYEVSVSEPITVEALAGDDAVTVHQAVLGTETILRGDAGDDRLVFFNAGSGAFGYGGEGDDLIMSDWPGGTFYGEGGNDHIDLHDGVADGGAGDDVLLADAFSSVHGGEGDDYVDGGFASGGDGADEVYGVQSGDGGAGDDIVSGDNAEGGTGSDEVAGESASGGEGNDLLLSALYGMSGGSGRDVFFLFDRLYDTESPDHRLIPEAWLLDFDPAQDRIASPVLFYSTTEFTGVAGQMVFDEDTGRTRVDLDGDGEWDLSLFGAQDSGHFIPIVLDGTDAGETASGNGLLVGRGGDDRLNGGLGDDMLFGGIGDDVISGGRNDDLLVGHAGKDRLHGGWGDDELDGGDGADTLSGNLGDDLAYGGAGNDLVAGQAGDDILLGDGGKDRLNGSEGDDRLTGGTGDDYLVGGSGSDTFVFEPGDSGAVLGTRDRIADFESSLDRIDLTAFAGARVTITEGASYDLLAIDQEDDGTVDSVILVAVVGSSHLSMADLLL